MPSSEKKLVVLTSEVRSFETLPSEPKVSRRRLADRNVETDRVRVVLVSTRNAVHNGLSGPDDKS